MVRLLAPSLACSGTQILNAQCLLWLLPPAPTLPLLLLQTALPGLSGFALGNCRKRYKMLMAHMETLFKMHPGDNGQAMQVGGGRGGLWAAGEGVRPLLLCAA